MDIGHLLSARDGGREQNGMKDFIKYQGPHPHESSLPGWQ